MPVNEGEHPKATTVTPKYNSASGFATSEEISSLYQRMNLAEAGLSKNAFEKACKGYNNLIARKVIDSAGLFTICDFSQSSKNKRLYLIDMHSHEVVLNTYVAHGKNSGNEYANRFSNRPESRQSSLGFYITNNTYFGEHGLSLRITGLEPGFNDRALRRAIVVHGASYIGEGSIGRSYGCPAVPKEESARLINTIKNGTCLFIYHPSNYYLKGSKLLND